MLELTCQDPELNESDGKFNEEFGKLICRLQLDRELINLTKQGERMPLIYDDKRSFVRYICILRGILFYEQQFPSIPRQPSAHAVVTSNVSRSGLAFFHFEQLYPQERLSIWIEGRKPLKIEVVRCCQKAECCFEIGAIYIRGTAQDVQEQPEQF